MGRPKGVITPAQIDILKVLSRFQFLRWPQITKATRSPKADERSRLHIKALHEQGMLDYRLVGVPRIGGNYPKVWFLTDAGFQYLKEAELVPDRDYRHRVLSKRSQPFLEHTLSSNELVILATRLARERANVEVARFRTEHDLFSEPVYIEDNGKRRALIPDAWVDLRTPKQSCIAFELDRGTEFKKAVYEKIRGYLIYEKGAYQDAFDTESLTVAWVITEGGWKRVEELIRWTQNVLRDAGVEDEADLFRFTHVDLETIEPQEFFFAPIWRKPFDNAPLPLIQGG